LGDPLLRPPESVAEDVVNGLVTLAAAEVDYGVILCADRSLDHAATATLRAQRLAAQRAEPPTFAFGAARDRYRERWPVELEDALAEAIGGHPPVLRQFLHHELKRLIAERLDHGERVLPALLPSLVDEVAHRFTAGYPSRDEPLA
jgi:hypothetical protein